MSSPYWQQTEDEKKASDKEHIVLLQLRIINLNKKLESTLFATNAQEKALSNVIEHLKRQIYDQQEHIIKLRVKYIDHVDPPVVKPPVVDEPFIYVKKGSGIERRKKSFIRRLFTADFHGYDYFENGRLL